MGHEATVRIPSDEPVPPSAQNRVFFITLLLGILFLSALLFRPFVASVITGVLLAYFAYPIYRFFRAILRLRALSGFVTLLFVLALFVVPFVFLGLVLVDDARDFATQLVTEEPPEFVLQGLDLYIQTRVEDPDNASMVEAERQEFVHGLLRQSSTWLIDQLPDIIALVSDFVLGLFIVSFVMFYVFVDGTSMVDFVRRTFPLPPHQTGYLLAETKSAVDAIFVGQLASAILQGLVGGIGFWLFGVPNPVFWGAIMAVLSLLPVVGAFLVWGPAGLILIAGGAVADGVMLLAWGALLVSNVDNVAKPILIGDRADIHPILVLIGVLGGLVVFGVIGFIVGPLVLGLAVAFLKVWNEEYHDGNGWIFPQGRRPGVPAPAPASGSPSKGTAPPARRPPPGPR